MELPKLGHFEYNVRTHYSSTVITTGKEGLGFELSREEFERLNSDLLESIKEPIVACLEDGGIDVADVDEVVLVGGSTRIPRVRSLVGEFFKYCLLIPLSLPSADRSEGGVGTLRKAPNFGVDPDLAVTTGAAVQAGVLVGGWPLRVSATELTSSQRKRHIYTPTPPPPPHPA